MKSESWSWNWIPFLKIWLHRGACQILTVQLSFGFHGPTNPPCAFPILRWISVTFHFFHCDKQCYSKHPHKFILLPCIIISKWAPQGGIAISSVQLLSRVWLFVTPWIAARQASLSITNSQSLLKLMSIESVMPSSHLILCHPLLLLPLIFPSIRVFSNESTLHLRWPKYWSFSFSISPSKEHPGLISFRMDWLDLLEVQGSLKSILQHHSSKLSIFQHSAFSTV